MAASTRSVMTLLASGLPMAALVACLMGTLTACGSTSGGGGDAAVGADAVVDVAVVDVAVVDVAARDVVGRAADLDAVDAVPGDVHPRVDDAEVGRSPRDAGDTPGTDAGQPSAAIHPPDLRWVEPIAPPAAVKAQLVLALGTPHTPRVAAAGPQLHLLGLEAKADPQDPLVQLAALWSSSEPLGAPSAGCAADFDGDGYDDLFLAHQAGTLAVHLHTDLALTRVQAQLAPLDVDHALCGDWSEDGHPDVLVALGGVSPHVMLLLGDGAGGLTPAAGGGLTLLAPATALSAADVDGDLHTDVLVMFGPTTPARLLLGDGFGALLDAPIGTLPAQALAHAGVLADLDADGAVDAFLLTESGALLWINDGEGHLSDHTGLGVAAAALSAQELIAADLDLDGATDLLASGPTGVGILRNDGTGRLFDYSTTLTPRPGRESLTSTRPLDLDLDGDLDLVAVRPDGSASWLRSWPPWPAEDGDGDGYPAPLDVCPDDYDPTQPNRDAWHFGCPDAATCLAETGCVLSTDGAGHAWLICAEAGAPKDAAVAWCTTRGASLVVLDSLQEQAAIAGAAAGHLWIDLSDDQVEGQFLTSAGAAPPYLGWAEGQPDDFGDLGEDCVELVTTDPLAAVWNDVPCGSARGWVCEDTTLEAWPDPGDACDVCPNVHDPEQHDSDGDGVGDACAPSFE